jgi:hypothetical protein
LDESTETRGLFLIPKAVGYEDDHFCDAKAHNETHDRAEDSEPQVRE